MPEIFASIYPSEPLLAIDVDLVSAVIKATINKRMTIPNDVNCNDKVKRKIVVKNYRHHFNRIGRCYGAHLLCLHHIYIGMCRVV